MASLIEAVATTLSTCRPYAYLDPQQYRNFKFRSFAKFPFSFNFYISIFVQFLHFHFRSISTFSFSFNFDIFIFVQFRHFHFRSISTFSFSVNFDIFIFDQFRHFHFRSISTFSFSTFQISIFRDSPPDTAACKAFKSKKGCLVYIRPHLHSISAWSRRFQQRRMGVSGEWRAHGIAGRSWGPFLTSAPGANFDPGGGELSRGEFCTLGVKLSPGGVKFSVCPSILLNECSPLGVNKVVIILPRGQILPLGAKFTPTGKFYPWGPGLE
jgi:hypothetical protein